MSHTILIGHGSGGVLTHNLIREVFLESFGNSMLEALCDATIAEFGNSQLAFTTDSYVVDPPFFPGGDIGRLAVCGTVNDLSVSGADPLYLSASFILEEGFPMNDLKRIAKSMAIEAKKAGIQIITGDTKVVKKGQCDKIFLNTAGIGRIEPKYIPISKGTFIQPGDGILVNGFLGDHEIAVLAARENLEFEIPVYSDVAPLNGLTRLLKSQEIEIHFMRDITRGGLATVLSELVSMCHLGILIEENQIPVREQVNGICEIYGFNPLYLANEGKMAVVVSGKSVDSALEIMRHHELGKDARMIGRITESNPGMVLMNSVIGSKRIIEKLAGEQLPRIC